MTRGNIATRMHTLELAQPFLEMATPVASKPTRRILFETSEDIPTESPGQACSPYLYP